MEEILKHCSEGNRMGEHGVTLSDSGMGKWTGWNWTDQYLYRPSVPALACYTVTFIFTYI